MHVEMGQQQQQLHQRHNLKMCVFYISDYQPGVFVPLRVARGYVERMWSSSTIRKNRNYDLTEKNTINTQKGLQIGVMLIFGILQ